MEFRATDFTEPFAQLDDTFLQVKKAGDELKTLPCAEVITVKTDFVLTSVGHIVGARILRSIENVTVAEELEKIQIRKGFFGYDVIRESGRQLGLLPCPFSAVLEIAKDKGRCGRLTTSRPVYFVMKPFAFWENGVPVERINFIEPTDSPVWHLRSVGPDRKWDADDVLCFVRKRVVSYDDV